MHLPRGSARVLVVAVGGLVVLALSFALEGAAFLGAGLAVGIGVGIAIAVSTRRG